jgi:hypothetical protein
LKTRTRITEAGLRRLIRHFLNEGPLAEIPPANPGERGRPAYFSLKAADFPPKIAASEQIDTTKSSVGHHLNPEAVKLFLHNTEDNWAIFTLPFAASKPRPAGSGIPGPPGPALKDGDFKEELMNVVNKKAEEFEIPKGTKILVVGDSPFENDNKEVPWVVGHDIFGHNITSLERRDDKTSLELATKLGRVTTNFYNSLQKRLGVLGKDYNPEELHNSYVTGAKLDAAEAQLKAASKNMKLTIKILTRLIHKALPADMKLAGSETDDIKPDIFATILLDPSFELNKQEVINHLDLPIIADLIQRESVPPKEIEDFKNIISDAAVELFKIFREHVKRWLASIESDTPKLIHLW